MPEGEDVKGEAPKVVDDGVPRVGSTLETDDHVGGLSQHVGDLALALIAPVGAHDCFNHNEYLRGPGFATAPADLPYPAALSYALQRYPLYRM